MRSAILFVLTLIHFHTSAQDLIPVDESNDGFRVDDAYLYSDSTLKMTVKEVAALPETVWEKELLAKYSKDVEWIRVPFVNETSEDIVKVLYLSNPICHQLDLFFIQNGELTDRHIRSGLVVSKDYKLYNDPGYPYLVTFPANTELYVLIRVHDPLSSVQVPIHLLSPDRAYAFKDANLTLMFFWLGVLTLSLLISLLLYMNTKQKMFIYYSIFAIGTGIVITSTTGVITMFIDKDPHQIITNYYQWGAILLINFMPRFINSLIPIFSLNRLAMRIIKALGLVTVLIGILYCIPYFKFSFFFTTLFIKTVVSITGVTFLYVLVTLGISSFKKFSRAFPLFIVYLIYLTLAFLNVIMPLFGFAQDTLNGIHVVLIGSAIEILAFMTFMGQAALAVYKDRHELLEQVSDNQDLVMQALVKGQEDERNRFARDLHDGFGGMISALNLNLKGLKSISQKDIEYRMDVFDSSSDILKSMHKELKNICFDLMPQTLIRNGLEAGIIEFADRINSSGQKTVEINVFGMKERLSEIQEISLYRIIQEWINNILKHSDASQISIQLTGDQKEVTLLIEDNGLGFDKALLTSNKGNGWKNLNSRANLISGEMELETNPAMKGNTLILNAPIDYLKEERKAYLETRSA